jgi:hypothetical protein
MQARIYRGAQFGRWTVLEDAEVRHAKVLCRCVCGVERAVDAGNLLAGLSHSCGCFRRERAARLTAATHGHTAGGAVSPTYNSWRAMIGRCRRPTDAAYHWYGGRDITVCDRWLSFENFLQDMGVRPAGMTLDRTDSDGNYQPDNCRWATAAQQTANRRKEEIGHA